MTTKNIYIFNAKDKHHIIENMLKTYGVRINTGEAAQAHMITGINMQIDFREEARELGEIIDKNCMKIDRKIKETNSHIRGILRDIRTLDKFDGKYCEKRMATLIELRALADSLALPIYEFIKTTDISEYEIESKREENTQFIIRAFTMDLYRPIGTASYRVQYRRLCHEIEEEFRKNEKLLDYISESNRVMHFKSLLTLKRILKTKKILKYLFEKDRDTVYKHLYRTAVVPVLVRKDDTDKTWVSREDIDYFLREKRKLELVKEQPAFCS